MCPRYVRVMPQRFQNVPVLGKIKTVVKQGVYL